MLILRKQIELYTELIKDYDFKTKELTIENTDLKSFIASMYKNLNKSSNLARKNPNSADESEAFLLEITRLPFENTFSKLNKEIEQKFKTVNELIVGRNYQQTLSNVSDSQLSASRKVAPNSTISSINSIDDDFYTEIRTRKFTHNKDDLLNATFTIQNSDNEETDDMDDILHETNECASNLDKLNFLDDAKMLDQSDFVNSLNQIKSTKKSTTKTNGQALAFSSSSSSSSSASNSFNYSDPNSTASKNRNKSCDKKDANDTLNLTEEKNKIAQEKKFLLEQKLMLENEMMSFRKISSDLAKQVGLFSSSKLSSQKLNLMRIYFFNSKQDEFRDEQEDFYQSKLLSSFIEQSKGSKKK